MILIKNKLFELANKISTCNVKDTIVVCGAPRSGTTWAAELMRELPGYKMLDEPLHLKSSSLVERPEQMDWREYIPIREENREVERILNLALAGRVKYPHMWRFKNTSPVLKLIEHVSQRKLVVKAIRTTRMLPWLSNRYPVRAIFSIIRHPCAVTASRLKSPWFSPEKFLYKKEEIKNNLNLPSDVREVYISLLSNIKNPVEVCALSWSVDTHMMLQGPVKQPWCVTTYESLIREAESETKRLFDFLGESVPEGITERLHKPSNSAASDLKTSDTKVQLSKWRDALGESQIRAILEIVEEFGLGDIYSESLYPNTEALRARVEEAQNESADTNTQRK